MKFKVYSPDGIASKGFRVFNFPSFADDKGVAALSQVVIAHQANARQGNASTKTRAEVAGSGKKLFRQKGSGTARQGSRRVPHQRHGGVAHGPKPRDYSQKINRKMKQLALQRALFERAQSGGISVIESFDFDAPKTKVFNSVLKNIMPSSGKVLVVDDVFAQNTALSARNVDGLSMIEAGNLNALDLVRSRNILISAKGIETLITRANGGES